SENSALKNRAPSSLTALRTSESTSMAVAASNLASLLRIQDGQSSPSTLFAHPMRCITRTRSKTGLQVRRLENECDCERNACKKRKGRYREPARGGAGKPHRRGRRRTGCLCGATLGGAVAHSGVGERPPAGGRHRPSCGFDVPHRDSS